MHRLSHRQIVQSRCKKTIHCRREHTASCVLRRRFWRVRGVKGQRLDMLSNIIDFGVRVWRYMYGRDGRLCLRHVENDVRGRMLFKAGRGE